MRCVFREQPPPLLRASLVEAGVLREAIAASFYSWSVDEIALYPSLVDALRILSEALGGLKPLTPIPSFLEMYTDRDGGAWLAANPTPRGDALDCETACSHEPLVVYEGGRVALHAPSIVECGCRVYSIASLRDYGIDSSIAWIAGLEGGISGSSKIPGYVGLHEAVDIVRRMRLKGLAAIAGLHKPVYTGPFAAFVDKTLPIPGEWRDGAKYGARGFYAYSLYMEPGCYPPWRS